MKLEPIRKYSQPRIPTSQEAKADPDLLRLLPKRWQTNPAVLTAMIGAGLLVHCSRPALAQERGVLMGKIAPPRAMFSESEPRAIIIDEAKKAGIVFAEDRKMIDVPVTELAAAPIKGGETSDATTHITLDGTEAKRGISFEYVSEADARAASKRISGVATIDSVADALRDEGKKQLKGRVLIIPEVKAYSVAEVDKDIRAQVKDFIKWLKGQGVI